MTANPPPENLPPSATLVYRVLSEADDPMTRRELVQEAGLPRSTTLYALQRLRDAEAVERVEAHPNPTKPRYDAVAVQHLDGRED